MQNFCHVIWFKKNLRFVDNEILVDRGSNSILIYIIEDELWKQKDMSKRQWDFIHESLKELQQTLLGHNLFLNIVSGDALQFFQKLEKKYKILRVISEQETGINWTYQRDKKLKKYFQSNNTIWEEVPFIGVKRGSHNRDEWAKSFKKEITKPLVPVKSYIKDSINLKLSKYIEPKIFYNQTPCPYRQKGGSAIANSLLNSFLEYRGENYQKEMSSPLSAENSCSRLSVHFSHGTISLKQAFHKALERKNQLSTSNKIFTKSINSFLSRLHWRSHFVQKLEDQPSIENKSFISIYDNLRDRDEQKLQLWIDGKTGIPFIDACMIYLKNYGWINFRMRAMLSSFAAYNLWLDWRFYGPQLGSLFTDFEPGIHYSQIQMQSGTTGINTIRMYNPFKQSEDQDPNAEFIKQNISFYKKVPNHIIHNPDSIAPLEKEFLPAEWIEPIISVKNTARFAKEKIFNIRKSSIHKTDAKIVYQKHGSRKH